MLINQANIDNLTRLWRKYGARTVNKKLAAKNKAVLQINSHWPHRCWFDGSSLNKDILAFEPLPHSTIYPIWPNLSAEQTTDINTGNKTSKSAEQRNIEALLINNNWHCILEQTAMYLPLSKLTDDGLKKRELENKTSQQTGFSIIKVTTLDELNFWLDIASKAFAYRIDQIVFQNLMTEQDIQILLAYDNNQPIATGLLFKTGNIIGVHQVAVHPSAQGKGYARMLMQALITRSQIWQGTHLVLQASAAGKPLYESLGFKKQFLIKCYQKG
ncbi:MAG: GNAT family N-acetyltransferase [Thalassotalea sp.]